MEKREKPLYLTYSLTRLYTTCPRAFSLSYLYKLQLAQEEDSLALSTGRLLHLIFEHYLTDRPLPELPPDIQPQAEHLLQVANRLKDGLVMVEQPFAVPFSSYGYFISKPDFVWRDPETGALWVGDLKSSRSVNQIVANYYNFLQPWVYLDRAQIFFNEEIRGVYLVAISTTKNVEVREEPILVTREISKVVQDYLQTTFFEIEEARLSNHFPKYYNCHNPWGRSCMYRPLCWASTPEPLFDKLVQEHLDLGVFVKKHPLAYLEKPIAFFEGETKQIDELEV